jgi:hypothetical protein
LGAGAWNKTKLRQQCGGRAGGKGAAERAQEIAARIALMDSHGIDLGNDD